MLLSPPHFSSDWLDLFLSTDYCCESSPRNSVWDTYLTLIYTPRIPGPIEVSDDVCGALTRSTNLVLNASTQQVLYANARPPTSHTSADFIPVFGDCIRMMRRAYSVGRSVLSRAYLTVRHRREVLFTKDGQPFLIAGSGTLGEEYL